MRLTSEELQKIMKEKGINKIYSWSKVNTFLTSPYEYCLKYVLNQQEDIRTSAYAPLGGMCHTIIEKLYNNEIEYDEMANEFDDAWVSAIDIANLQFDRNDSNKNEAIKNGYYNNLIHFFKNHSKLDRKIELERFILSKIDSYYFQGYIDAIFKDDDGNYNIIDWKTSTEYKGAKKEKECGQLVVYAIGLNQLGVPFDKIRIAWNFLKYVTVTFEQKNGTIKDRNIERSKIGESLQSNAKTWLKEFGYKNKIDDYLMEMIDANGIDCLPDEVKAKYKISDCYVYVDLTEKLINEWKEKIVATVKDIEIRESDYEQSQNEKLFWDSDDSVKAQSYYFSNLCGYSANLHKPYQKYLESRVMDGDLLGTHSTSNNIHNNCVSDGDSSSSGSSMDMSWLNDI